MGRCPSWKWSCVLRRSRSESCSQVTLISELRGGFGGFVTLERTAIIAAVEGPAVAGGCEPVLACDMVVASDSASFGPPEVKRSLVATAGGTTRLPKRLPPNIAMEMALTGEPSMRQERTSKDSSTSFADLPKQ